MGGMSRVVAVGMLAGLAVVSSACTGGTTAVPPAAHSAGPGMSGTHGNVVFASENVGWVIAPHAARHQTDVYRTTDRGLNWRLWSSLPEVAGPPPPGVAGPPIAMGESALLLMPVDSDRHPDHLMFRADGGGWERRNFPIEPPNVTVGVQFLADLQHGWLLRDHYGDLFQTVDGGRTWKVVTSLRRFEDAGPAPPVFWSATDGRMFEQDGDAFKYLLTHDSGATWQAVDIPVIQANKDLAVAAKLTLSPGDLTMFDGVNGVMPIYVWDPADPSRASQLRKVLYVTRTADAGAHWSAAQLVRLPVVGVPVFLESQRWVLAGDRRVYLTSDAGGHWQEGAGLDTGLWRGNGSLRVLDLHRNVVTLTFSQSDIQWLVMSTDAGAHWKPVPLPDIREPASI